MHPLAETLRRLWRIRGPAGARRAWFIVGVVVATAALAACQPVQPSAAVAQAAADDIQPVSDVPAVGEAAPAAEPLEAAGDAQADQNPSKDQTPDAALAEKGLAVYRAQYCGVCHTLSSAGTKGTFGPPHDGMGVTAAQRIADPGYSGAATTAAGYLYESLVKPEAYFVEGYISSSHRMPPYTHLSEDELQELVAFLLAQQ